MSEEKMWEEFKAWCETKIFPQSWEEDKGAFEVFKEWQVSRAQSDAEIAKRDAIIARQAEALKAVAEYLTPRVSNHGITGRTIILPQVNQALSASAESVAAWEAEKLEPMQYEIAELRMELDCAKNRICSGLAALCEAGIDFIEKSNQNIPMVEIQKAEDKLRFVISNTKEAAETYDREHAAKVLETAAKICEEMAIEYCMKNSNSNSKELMSACWNQAAAAIRAANEK